MKRKVLKRAALIAAIAAAAAVVYGTAGRAAFAGAPSWTHHAVLILLTGLVTALAAYVLSKRYVVMQRISCQKRTEQLQFELTRQLLDIIEFLPDATFVIDRDKKIIAWNRAIEIMTGVKKEEIIGKGDYAYAVPFYGEPRPVLVDLIGEDNKEIEAKYKYVERREHMLYGEVYIPVVFGGKGAFLWIIASPLFDRDGNVAGAIESIRDITKRKRAEEEKTRLEEQLRHSQKMEAVGQLAGGIAHDFNNILTAIISFGSLLQMRMGADDPHRTYASQILNAAERAAYLVQSLLAFSRKQVIDPKPISINTVVRSVEGLLSRIIGEEIELQTVLASDNITVMADAGQMEQVLMNLATNARDAMPYAGILTISTARAELDTEYAELHGLKRAGRHARITVSDTGSGMDEHTKKKIFEPFFTTKETGRGTGLGLAIVYGIIKQHGGCIDVSSEPGRGTAFEIYLPEIRSSVQNDSSAVQNLLPSGGRETVLLAEDNQEVRAGTKQILEEFGYSVIEAVDGEDAVSKFIQHRDAVHMLLLDVVMPKKNGKEAYEEIKKSAPGIKALFLSGYTDDIIHTKGMRDADLNFIPKPVSPGELLREVKRVLSS